MHGPSRSGRRRAASRRRSWAPASAQIKSRAPDSLVGLCTGAGTRGAPGAEAAAVAAEATKEGLAAEAPAVQASIETLLAQDEGEAAIQYAPQTIRFCVLDDDVGETVDAALDEALTWNMT